MRDDDGRISVVTGSRRRLVDKLKTKFLDEAKALFKFNHPGIVKVHDIFEENGTAYFTMDYIEGVTLREMVERQGPLSEAKALKYIRQTADALAYVHSKNRLHLDIKPDNIMIDTDDQAKLIDFGVSKQYDEADGHNTSTLMGQTAGYAPLEQMSQKVSQFYPATDIYALGATLYFLLTGKTPPSAVDLVVGLDQIGALPHGVSEATRRAISEAMHTQFDQRPQTIAEWLNILDGKGDKATNDVKPTASQSRATEPLMKRERAESRVTQAMPRATEPTQRATKRMLWPWIVAAAVAVVAMIIIVLPDGGSKMAAAPVIAENNVVEADSTPEPKSPTEVQEPEEAVEPSAPETELERLTRLAESGNAQDKYNLGMYYHNKGGTQANFKEQVKWFRKAANQGHTDAQYMMGFCYDGGYGIAQNYAEAAKWYEKAAEKGHADALFQLGCFYYLGRGVTLNSSEAIKLFTRAYEQGNKNAPYAIGKCYIDRRDYPEAIKWFKIGASSGDYLCPFEIGELYYEGGNGLQKNYAEAAKWFRVGAERDAYNAQAMLGRCYYEGGNGLQKDYAEAVLWLKKASRDPNSSAVYYYGLCYYEGGVGVQQDKEVGLKWIREAAARGDKNAQAFLEAHQQ